MKSIIFTLLLLPLVSFSQTSTPTYYEDFPIFSNLDSLEKAVYAKRNYTQQYLIGLISLEKSRHAFQSDKFGVDLDNINQLAIQQKFHLAIATSQYLIGTYEIRNNVSKATPNIIASIQYFESKKDITAMLKCYSLMIAVNKSFNVVNSDNREQEVRGNVRSIKAYYDKIMVLGEESRSVLDKIIQFQTIMAYYSLIHKTSDLKNEINALNKAVALVNANPQYEYTRVVSYTRAISMYQNAGLYKKALTYELMCYKMNNNHQKVVFNNNLGYSYTLVSDYKNAEIYAKKAVDIAKKSRRNDLDTQIAAYYLLADTQYGLKKYELAWASRNSADSLYQVNEKSITDKAYLMSQAQYETEKKEQANRELREEQQRLYIYLLLGLLAFIVFAIVLFRLQSANSRIKELMKHRDQFYTIVAHDLRGPINTLADIGNIIRFLVKQNRTADLTEVTNRIDTVSAETTLLLNNLIEWGKSSNYNVVTKQQVFDAAQVIKELYDSHKTLAEAKGIDMTIDMPEQLKIAADPKSLSLILRNLLDNARKFTPNGETIKIFVEKLTNQVHIHVKDSGQGIPPEQLNYLQEVFAHKTKPEVGEHGLGLGIILIHDFAHKNNIALNVTSEVGVGSCFSLVVNA